MFSTIICQLSRDLKKVKGVEQVLSIPDAIILNKNIVQKNWNPAQFFRDLFNPRHHWTARRKTFENLLFYRGLLYNPETHAYLMAISVNKQIMNSAGRTAVVSNIVNAGNAFGKAHQIANAL